MAQTDTFERCGYCPTLVAIDGDENRDSDGETTCSTCYTDGTAYLEPVDAARDSGGGW